MSNGGGEIRIGFIGCGAMAQALAAGLVRSGVDPEKIAGSDPMPAQRQAFAKATGAETLEDNEALVSRSDAVVVAVKPPLVSEVLSALGDGCEADKPLWISIAAGITLEAMGRILPTGTRIIRAMPNTPALVSQGCTAFCGNIATSETDVEIADTLFKAVGRTWAAPDETVLDAVTGLSGSGPAYVFLFLEALTDAGVEEGIPAPAARLLATQTLLGAATLAHQSEDEPATLRERVSSPGGTTVAGLAALDAGGFRSLIRSAVSAATRRSRELSQD